LLLNKDIKSIHDFSYNDIHIDNYSYHPHIPGKVAV
jgi:thymidylate synthase